MRAVPDGGNGQAESRGFKRTCNDSALREMTEGGPRDQPMEKPIAWTGTLVEQEIEDPSLSRGLPESRKGSESELDAFHNYNQYRSYDRYNRYRSLDQAKRVSVEDSDDQIEIRRIREEEFGGFVLTEEGVVIKVNEIGYDVLCALVEGRLESWITSQSRDIGLTRNSLEEVVHGFLEDVKRHAERGQ